MIRNLTLVALFFAFYAKPESIQSAPLTRNENDKVIRVDGTPGHYDSFGGAVAIEEDTLVIGSYTDARTPSTASGAAYVYQRTGSDWIRTQTLSPSGSGHYFGQQIDIAGNYMAISGRGAISSNNPSGGVYIYQKQKNTWALDTVVRPPADLIDIDGGTDFGRSIAFDGQSLIVGAMGDDHHGTWSGAAFVFSRVNGQWIEQAKLVSPESSHFYGQSVAISGNTAAVGADASGIDIYRNINGNWILDDHLLPDQGESFAALDQRNIAITQNTVLVGSQQLSSGGLYVFERQDGQWERTAKLATVPYGSTDAKWTVAAQGDWLVGGASIEWPSGTYGDLDGAAYVFHRINGAWQLDSQLLGSDTFHTDAAFGFCADIHDGEVAIGRRPNNTPASSYEPGVYVFEGVPEPATVWLFASGLLALLTFNITRGRRSWHGVCREKSEN
jgi:hypothetical protein